MVFEKENKGPTMKRNNGNEENGIDNKADGKDEPKCNKKEENDNDMIVTLSPIGD